MKKLNILLLLLTFLCGANLQAQEGPFLDELYDYEVEENVFYGGNATILPLIVGQADEAIWQPLIADVYTPVGDNNTARPLVIVMHTGNFFPHPQNSGTGGTIRDSTVVEVCKRLAKRGYVAASIDYRLGWNPADESQDIRKFFLINAAYRGIQDCRTAVRYFRLTEQDGGNPYGIDPDKIGTWGVGTGGYIAAGVATVDQYSELVIPKYLIDLGTGPLPMVIEQINGDINGTSVGIVPPGYPALPPGDTLCYPNHVVYGNGEPISSEISFTVNNGGATGDISWVNNDMAPWVSYHVPTDPAAPYTTGILTVPGTGDPADPTDDFPVVEVSGSYDIQAAMNAGGYNDIFDQLGDNINDYSDVADARNDGNKGLFPFPNSLEVNSAAPWDFYADDNFNVANGLNPIADIPLAKTYWDTIFAYVGPRACLALDLGCEGLTNVDDLVNEDVKLLVAPNPATSSVNISVKAETTMNAIELYDLSGRLVQDLTQVNASSYTINRNGLAKGVYYVKVHLNEGIAVQKLVFN